MNNWQDLKLALIGDSYFSKTGHAEAYLRQLIEAGIPPHSLAAFQDICFFMIKPDAIFSGSAERIIKWLEISGFDVIWSKPVSDKSGASFEDLYKFNLTVSNDQNQFVSWWINSSIYRSGPALALLLTPRRKDKSGGTHIDVASKKGFCVPWLAKPGTLRWDFEGCNRVMNLVHASDDPISSIREFLIFFTPAELSTAVNRFHIQPEEQVSIERELALTRILFGSNVRRVSFSELACRLKLQLTQTMARASSESDVHRLCEQLSGLYIRWYDREISGSSQFEGLKMLINICKTERSLLMHHSSTPATAQLSECMMDFANPENYSDGLAKQIVATLHQRNVYLDPWDELILSSSMHYSEDLLKAS